MATFPSEVACIGRVVAVVRVPPRVRPRFTISSARKAGRLSSVAESRHRKRRV